MEEIIMNEQERIRNIMKAEEHLAEKRQESAILEKKFKEKIWWCCLFLYFIGLVITVAFAAYYGRVSPGEGGDWIFWFLGIWCAIVFIIQKRYGKTPPTTTDIRYY